MNHMRWFEYKHLPTDLHFVTQSVHQLAFDMDADLPECAEKTAGFRKLLEAKDCFVRAAIEGRNAEES